MLISRLGLPNACIVTMYINYLLGCHQERRAPAATDTNLPTCVYRVMCVYMHVYICVYIVTLCVYRVMCAHLLL